MTDPGALGTLIIGLESVRLDGEADDRRRTARRVASRHHRRAAFIVVAGWLRQVADRIDRPAGQAGLATR